MKAARSVPGCRRRSMRLRRPAAPNRSCAAPMSITTSGRAGRVHRAGHSHGTQRQRALQLQRRCAASARHSAGNECGHRRRVQEHGGRRQQRQPVGAGGRQGHQGRRHCRHGQRIHAHHAHRQALAVGAGGVGREFQHRAGQHHLRMGGHAAEEGFVERSLDAAQLQVGLAIDGAHRAGKLAQRRGVDQVHRERQRHAQHHRHHRGRVAPGMVAQFLPGEGAQQGQHAGIVPLASPGARSRVV
jgi:hypothetical protein